MKKKPEKLKPCPWCGKTPKVERDKGNFLGYVTLYWVKCNIKRCASQPGIGSTRFREKAIEEWNTRKGEK